MKQSPGSVAEYLASLPDDRRKEIEAVRDIILRNLPKGFVEAVGFGMLNYVIPLERYPKTYNKQPLMLAALASQKNYMSVHLMTVYGDPKTETWFRESFTKAGKKLDMGKSCVRFKSADDLPLDIIGQAIARVSLEEHIQRYERSRIRP